MFAANEAENPDLSTPSRSIASIQSRLELPPAVVRFAVRKAADEDEVQVAWGVDFGDCNDYIDGLSHEEALAVFAKAGDLPSCSVVVVHGLAHLSLLDQAAGRCAQGEAGPLAIKAAVLSAMHHVMVKEAMFPVVLRSKSESLVPVRRLPNGWRIEVDLPAVADVPRMRGQEDPALAYGRFLWGAIDGENACLTYSTSRAIKALAVTEPATTYHIHAEPNELAKANTPIGQVLLTRHVVERASERLADSPGPARAASRMLYGLFRGALFDITDAMRAKRRKNPLKKSVRIYSQVLNAQHFVYVIKPSRDGGPAALITAYEVAGHQRDFVRQAMLGQHAICS